jgi:hypothetical protein
MRTSWAWIVLALLLDVTLVISFLSLGIAQASGGDEGLWAVLLFYLLIVVAPTISVIAGCHLLRQLAGRPRRIVSN